MLTTSLSLGLGLAFVLVGGINVWLVLEAWSRVKAAKASSRMLMLHRVGGYIFLGLFCVMTYFMLARLRSSGGDTSPSVTIHLALAMVLSPLLFIKVLIARYYKNQQGLLMPIGLTIFVLAFVLIASTSAPYLTRATKIERVSIDPAHVPAVTIDVNQASDLMQRRCSKCHNLDRVIGARKDAQGWIATVERMRSMAGAGITDADARTIVTYLVSQNQPKGSEANVRMEVARALVDQRCGRCHSLDRVYKTVETADEWRQTVARMAGYAAGSTGALQSGEDQRIIEYLSAMQTPDAVSRRKAQAIASSGENPAPQKARLATSPTVEPSRFDVKALGVVSMVFLGAVVLALRRPRGRIAPSANPAPKVTLPAPASLRVSSAPFILQLVQTTRQTPDATTLRFLINGERRIDARPGQFLTFSFLFDGKKETRCYSICSSPARYAYVEITPKRVDNGCVSVFLNERAQPGMTVEATGPFGQFCLTPNDRKIMMIAAGSGITPMMSMLRYFDDLCLDPECTLLYCVRTCEDIIFRRELEDLRARLKNFRYCVMLSKPHPEWRGERGHISHEFLARQIPGIDGRVFLLCGPPAFMENAHRILTEMGIPPDRIRQEAFGAAGAGGDAAVPRGGETGFTVEFAVSGKRATILEGQSLLEAANEAGVDIPSACRQGQCGTCKTRLLAGDVRMTSEQGLDAESKARGFVLTCVGHAKGDVTLDV